MYLNVKAGQGEQGAAALAGLQKNLVDTRNMAGTSCRVLTPE
jgi:hypothetical protein